MVGTTNDTGDGMSRAAGDNKKVCLVDEKVCHWSRHRYFLQFWQLY